MNPQKSASHNTFFSVDLWRSIGMKIVGTFAIKEQNTHRHIHEWRKHKIICFSSTFFQKKHINLYLVN